MSYNLHNILHLFTILFIVQLLMCTDDPCITFPETKTIGKIDGFIAPSGIDAVVYLLDAKVIDSVSVNKQNGFFAFNNILYGNYQLKIRADSFGVETRMVKVDQKFNSLGEFILQKFPFQINSVVPDENSKISSGSSYIDDSVITICISFKKQMNLQSLEKNIIIDPPLPIRISKSLSKDKPNDIYIAIPVFDFFKNKHIILTLKKEIMTVYFEPLDFDYAIHYYPDTMQLGNIVKMFFIKKTIPSESSFKVNINTQATITFQKLMNRRSVEQAFGITPFTPVVFLWEKSDSSEDICIIEFTKPLAIGEKHVIVFDTTLSTLNSIRPPCPLTLSFHTELPKIVYNSPSAAKRDVSPSTTFTYMFNFPVDSVSLVNAFSSVPPLDSIRYTFYDGRKAVIISHEPLMKDTTYSIIIDSTVKTYTGVTFGKIFYHRFSTYGPYESSPDTFSYIMKTEPGDTLSLLDFNNDICINFSTDMNRRTVENHIYITPPLNIEPVWNSNNTLLLHPLQPMKSSTVYKVTFDTGYQTSNGKIIGSRYEFSFKTKPVLLKEYYPLDGQVNVGLDNPVMLKFNTPIDTFLLSSKILFVPPVESLKVIVGDSGIYYITHSRYSSGTNYNMIVNDSISDQYGVIMGRRYTFEFTTAK